MTGPMFERACIAEFSLIPNKQQKVGVGFDATDDQGKKWEFKYDDASAYTGNYYLEVKQTFDGFKTQVPSGVGLLQADWYVFGSPAATVFLTNDKIEELVARKDFKFTNTRPNANNNRDGCFSIGWLVPAATLMAAAFMVVLNN